MQADLRLRFDRCPATATMHPGQCPQPQLRFRACDTQFQTSEAEHSQIPTLHRHLTSPGYPVCTRNSTDNDTVWEVWPTDSKARNRIVLVNAIPLSVVMQFGVQALACLLKQQPKG